MDDSPSRSCLLCHKIRNAHELFAADLVFEFPHSIAFLGPWQYFEGYCIVVAKSHIVELFEIAASERAALMEEVSMMAGAIHHVVGPRKINYEWLGNQVPHMHWHLFPRQETDPNKLKAVWVELDGVDTDPEKKRHMERSERGKSQLITELRAYMPDDKL